MKQADATHPIYGLLLARPDLSQSEKAGGIRHHSASNKRMLWVPAGFGHGFLVLSEYAEFLYKTTDYYAPQYERCVIWNDPEIGIEWPVLGEPMLSAKDKAGHFLKQAELFA